MILIKQSHNIGYTKKNVYNIIGFQFSTYVIGTNKTLYQFLGIGPTDDKSEIKKAYYNIAKKLHPDVQQNQSKQQQKYVEEQFKQVQMAYLILKDYEKKKIYDTQMKEKNYNSFGEFQQEHDILMKYKHNLPPQGQANQHQRGNAYQQGQESAQNYSQGSYYHYYQHSQQAHRQRQEEQYRYTSTFYDKKENYNKARFSEKYKEFYENSTSSSTEGANEYKKDKKKRKRQGPKGTFFEYTKFHWFLGLAAMFAFDWMWDYHNDDGLERQVKADLESQKAVMEAAVRRSNAILSQQSLEDSPVVQENRKRNLEEERKQKQFSIVMVKDQKLDRKKVRKEEELKKQLNKEGIESMGKQFKDQKLQIVKNKRDIYGKIITEKDQNRPKQHKISIDQYESITDDYI